MFLWIALILLGLLILIRSEKVYRYRTALIDEISAASDVDLDLGRDWYWRFEDYNSVSYSEMMIKFWKPLDSFYPNKLFTEY